MIGVPKTGDLVTIYPAPGRRVQDGARALDKESGGRFLAAEGRDVTWTEFHYEQLRAGDILFHKVEPPKAKVEAPAKREKFNPHADLEALKKELSDREKKSLELDKDKKGDAAAAAPTGKGA